MILTCKKKKGSQKGFHIHGERRGGMIQLVKGRLRGWYERKFLWELF